MSPVGYDEGGTVRGCTVLSTEIRKTNGTEFPVHSKVISIVSVNGYL